MADDLAVPQRHVRQEGECARCDKLVWRDSPEQRWTDQYGRDRCRASWDDEQCDVPEFTEEEIEEPERPCIHAGAVPVESPPGQRVAWLCPACDQQLDADWQPPEPLQFVLELTVDSEPGTELPLSAPPGAAIERYHVTETRSIIMIRGTLPPA